MHLTPITLFTYNRPWHTRQTIEALQNNKLANQSDLIIFSDAPKNNQAKKSVKEVRDYLHTVNGFKSVKIIERDENWGLAKSIIDGVTQVVNEYGRVIVLEDDLVTSPYFLTFMNDVLSKYEFNNQVFGATGYAYPINNNTLPDSFFMKDEGCWGWATWQRSWSFFEKDTDKLLTTFNKSMIKEFNFDSTSNIWSQVLLNKKGVINTWAVYWYATVFLNDGLFLHPRDSFVKNIGHDGSGEHCNANDFYETKLVSEYNFQLPEVFIVNHKARDAHKHFFKSQLSLKNRLLNKIKGIIR